MNINELIKQAHDNAVNKGFYDCHICKGDGIIDTGESYDPCPRCDCSGRDKNKNIGELLMLVVSELGEALETTRRENTFALMEMFQSDIDADFDFESTYFTYVKNSFEAEIADTVIRIFDLCGYLNIDLEKHIELKMKYNETREYKHGKRY